jgi:hypothetical protein
VGKRHAYFDSQASAAAALKIDICKLRDAKREGCSAFRSGRVYRRALLDWLGKKKKRFGDEPEPQDDGLPAKSHWDRERARVDYERAVFNLEVEREKHISIEEITAAIGQMLAGFRTALNMLPGSAARWLIGLKDFHAIKNKLQSEVDAVLQALGRCRYLEQLAPAVIEKLFSEREADFRAALTQSCAAVFRELGRQALSDLVQREIESAEQPRIQAAKAAPEEKEGAAPSTAPAHHSSRQPSEQSRP